MERMELYLSGVHFEIHYTCACAGKKEKQMVKAAVYCVCDHSQTFLNMEDSMKSSLLSVM